MELITFIGRKTTCLTSTISQTIIIYRRTYAMAGYPINVTIYRLLILILRDLVNQLTLLCLRTIALAFTPLRLFTSKYCSMHLINVYHQIHDMEVFIPYPSQYLAVYLFLNICGGDPQYMA